MERTALRISVIGLGKLGSSMVAVFAARGYRVLGLDLNKEIINALQRGEAPVQEPDLQELITQYRNNIEVTTDYYKIVDETDTTMIIVPTPSDPTTGYFSNEYVLAAVTAIGKSIQLCNKYHQVVVVSTVMPGSMNGVIRNALESSSGRSVGCLDSEIGLAYNPEFIALGQVIKDMMNPDFILIGESDKRIGDTLEILYSTVVTKRPLRFHRMNFVNAEITKISINTYITTKITYANMLSDLCENLPGADVDVVSAAVGCDSRIGNKYIKGALAYGGPCFPRDNRAFVSIAKSLQANPLLAEATDQLNDYQLDRMARLCDHLRVVMGKSNLSLKLKIGILGLSYKPDTPVVECSPACLLVNKLIDNFDIIAYDPLAMPWAAKMCDNRMVLVGSIDELLNNNNIDILLIATAANIWKSLSFNHIAEKTLYILDCWRLLNKVEIEKAHQNVRIILLGNGDSITELKQAVISEKQQLSKLPVPPMNVSSRQFRVLVAGGSGFIGSHLARQLMKDGYYVICADWKKNEYFEENELCNEFLHMDLRVLNNCLMATKECDWVFNLAADMGGMGFIQSNNSVVFFNNTMISFNMLEASRQNNVKKYFYASSACVYPEDIQAEENIAALKESQAWPAKPQDAYGLEKLISEELAMHYEKDFENMQVRIARFHNIYGPQGQWKGGREKAPAAFCRKVLVAHEGNNNGIVNVWGDGKQTRSFCYIQDCIDGIMRLMNSDYNQPLNIGSDEMVSINDMIFLICEIEKKSVSLRHIPGPEGVRGRNSDNNLVKKVLNWAPSTKLKDGLKNTYSFIKTKLELERRNGVNIADYASSRIISQTTETLEAIGEIKRSDGVSD